MNKCKSIALLLLVLCVLLSPLAMVVPAQAATTTGEPTVYDIYDLTGQKENTLLGTSGGASWEQGVLIGNIDAADKENVSFKAKVKITDGNEHRFSLGALESDACVDIAGYGLLLRFDLGKVIFTRGTAWIASWDVTSADMMADTEIEFGYQDILTDGQRTGKRIFLKIDGVTLHTHDDTSGYLTGDTLGTKVALFHYGTSVQMNTTYTETYADVKVYDIYDLTGKKENTLLGTDGGASWEQGVLIGNIDAADKENVSFKAKVNITDEKRYRFSLGALESDACVDASGYGFELLPSASGHMILIRGSSHTWIQSWSGDTTGLKGEHEIEFGYRDILFGKQRIGKQLFLKVNGVMLYTYDDTSGYLTGDTLGTKVALFHYGTSVQMDTTYTTTYGEANVYDVYDLTNAYVVYRDPWVNEDKDRQKIGSVSVEDKEQVAFKFKLNLTDEAQRLRFSVGAQEDALCTDPKGYGLEIGVRFDSNPYKKSYITFSRNGSWVKNSWELDDVDFYNMIGEHDFEFGYRNIMFADEILGKQLYLKMDGVEVYTYDDMSGYLTGDALGTKVAVHYSNNNATAPLQLESTYTLKCYDVSDLTGAQSNTFNGTSNGASWFDGVVIGNIDAADKENVSFKAKVNITEDVAYRFSLAALESDGCVDVAGYGFELKFNDTPWLAFIRGSDRQWIQGWGGYQTALKGEYELEFGYRTIVFTDNKVCKEIFLKKDGQVLYSVLDKTCMTGDALGTKVALFHYGTTLQMDATTQTECTTHSYSTQTIAPDCLNDGKVLYTCTTCGHSYNEPGDAALGHIYVATVTPPTCTAQGYTTHVCSGCGDTYVDSYVDPTGHNHVATVTPHTCEAGGYTNYTCGGCGDTYTADPTTALGHKYVGKVETSASGNPYIVYTCQNDGSHTYNSQELQFTAVSVSLHNTLSVNFKVPAAVFTDAFTNPRAVFTLGYRQGENALDVNGKLVGDYYVFECYGINPQQIGDQITATVYGTYGGTEYSSQVYTYSVEEYCYNMLSDANSSDELKTLLVDLLNYGTAAKVYSQYYTEAEKATGIQILPNRNLTDAQKVYGTEHRTMGGVYDITGTAGSAAWKAASLVLSNSVMMRFRFEAESIDGVYAVANVDGSNYMLTKIVAHDTLENQYYVYFTGLSAHQLSSTVTVTLYNSSNQPISNQLLYSVETYAKNMIAKTTTPDNFKALMWAMMKYGDSANAYKQANS